MTQHLNDDTLRGNILLFDGLRAKTGIDAIKGNITKDEADAQFDRDINRLIETIHEYAAAYAESIIGEDNKLDVSGKDYGFKDQGKNELRTEQRTLNNEKKGKL